MPVSLPHPAARPDDRRRLLRMGALVAVAMALPVIALLVLENRLAARCGTSLLAEGVLVGKTLWRIERKTCQGAKDPFFDVLIGVESKAMASALTGRGEPHPVSVEIAGLDRAIIHLSGPVRGSSAVTVRLKRSGSPMERIDLESLVASPKGERP